MILTQDLCRVCAVPAGHEALAELGLTDATEVISIDPNALGEVIAQVEVVGKLLGAENSAPSWAAGLRDRADASGAGRAARLPTVNVFCMEWAEPPFAAGHWVPEMVEAVGATNVLGAKGEPSCTVTHREIHDAYPEVLVYMPRGYYLEEAEAEGEGGSSHIPRSPTRPPSATATLSWSTRPRSSAARAPYRRRAGDPGMGGAPRGLPGPPRPDHAAVIGNTALGACR